MLGTPINTDPKIPALGRVYALDGLRGLAIGLVLLRHLVPSAFGGAGFVGVQLFFVLSGFLITTLLFEERARSGRISFGAFYVRRALRLLPALYGLLITYAAFRLIVWRASDLDAWVGWVGLAAAYLTPFAGALNIPQATGLNPLWTLSVEEIFYLLWPLVLVAGFRFLTNRSIAVVTAALIAVAIGVRVLTFIGFGGEIYETPSTWIDALLIGCLLAQLRQAGALPTWRQWWVPVLLALPLAVASFWGGAKDSALMFGPGLTLLAIFAAALIWVCTSQDGLPSFPVKLLRSRVARYLGTRSYGLYLWNGVFLLQPVVRGSYPLLLASLVASFVAAELSYRLIEMPALKLKKRLQTGRANSVGREV